MSQTLQLYLLLGRLYVALRCRALIVESTGSVYGKERTMSLLCHVVMERRRVKMALLPKV